MSSGSWWVITSEANLCLHRLQPLLHGLGIVALAAAGSRAAAATATTTAKATTTAAAEATATATAAETTAAKATASAAATTAGLAHRFAHLVPRVLAQFFIELPGALEARMLTVFGLDLRGEDSQEQQDARGTHQPKTVHHHSP